MVYCHRNNLIHRDLKLENILLTSSDSNEIKVNDCFVYLLFIIFFLFLFFIDS